MKMTLKIQKAKGYAERLHFGQARKGDDSPYVAHPFAVAEILSNFTDDEGKKGGQFYTPRSIVKLLVEMLEPYKGRVFDSCCGSRRNVCAE